MHSPSSRHPEVNRGGPGVLFSMRYLSTSEQGEQWLAGAQSVLGVISAAGEHTASVFSVSSLLCACLGPIF